MCTRAAWQSRTPDGDDDHPAHAGAGLSLRECGRAAPARSAHRHPTANAAAERPGGGGSHANPRLPRAAGGGRRATPTLPMCLSSAQTTGAGPSMRSSPALQRSNPSTSRHHWSAAAAAWRSQHSQDNERQPGSQRRRRRSSRLPCQLVTAEPRARCCDSSGVRSSAFGSTASGRERAIALSRSRGRLHTPRRSAGHDRRGRAHGSAPVRPCRPGCAAW
jgi:hypothetical protein